MVYNHYYKYGLVGSGYVWINRTGTHVSIYIVVLKMTIYFGGF